jgi:hypothetical protein
MFAERQVVLLKEAQQMRDVEKLEAYVENPLTSTVFVVAYKNKKVHPSLIHLHCIHIFTLTSRAKLNKTHTSTQWVGRKRGVVERESARKILSLIPPLIPVSRTTLDTSDW